MSLSTALVKLGLERERAKRKGATATGELQAQQALSTRVSEQQPERESERYDERREREREGCGILGFAGLGRRVRTNVRPEESITVYFRCRDRYGINHPYMCTLQKTI
jgi:hypothetical protein